SGLPTEPAEPGDLDTGPDADGAAPSARERARLERIETLLRELEQPLPRAVSETASAEPAPTASAPPPELDAAAQELAGTASAVVAAPELEPGTTVHPERALLRAT